MTTDLIAAARLYDCDDVERGPCEQSSRTPETWCCPCVARALAAEVAELRAELDDRMADYQDAGARLAEALEQLDALRGEP